MEEMNSPSMGGEPIEMYGISDGSLVREKISGKTYRLYEIDGLAEGDRDSASPGKALNDGQAPRDADECGGSSVVIQPSPFREPATTAVEAFESVLERLQALRDRKGLDYGHPLDSIANLRASEDFGIPASIGVLLRMNDKMRRLQTFVRDGVLENESAEDSLLDLAVYTIWAIVLREEELELARQTLPPGRVVTYE